MCVDISVMIYTTFKSILFSAKPELAVSHLTLEIGFSSSVTFLRIGQTSTELGDFK